MIKLEKTLVMITGHEHPEYLIDTCESIKFYNKSKNYEVVFAIDNNKQVAQILINKYGKNHVFVSDGPNGWGRGILKTIVYALDYFNSRIKFDNLITFDSDALCVGPFINNMLLKIDGTDVFFVGGIWHSPGKDHVHHRVLRSSGFMSEFKYKFQTSMAAGPCMLWSKHCLKFMETVDLRPAHKFDKIYPHIHFAHDQISTWLVSCGAGIIVDMGSILELKWRCALPTFHTPEWGNVPITHGHTAIIHPTKSDKYTEDNCRAYFKFRRENPDKFKPNYTKIKIRRK